MTLDFASLLPLEERREVLKKRIEQLAAEGYQHNLNRQGAEINGRRDLVLEADQKIVEISNIIEVYQRDLNALPPEQG
jgi:hypothetical protein